MEMLQQIFELCIVPLLGILTTYLVKIIRKKSAEIDSKITDEKTSKYVKMLTSTITECVISTNQTYVDNLKGQNVFDKEAQEKAFEMTYNKVMNILTEEAKEYLVENGELWIVIQKKKGAPSAKAKMEEVYVNCEFVDKDKGYFILKSIRR